VPVLPKSPDLITSWRLARFCFASLKPDSFVGIGDGIDESILQIPALILSNGLTVLTDGTSLEEKDAH
jgi:hypothetical protein